VPIFDRKGSTVAALSATDRADRMSRHRKIEIRDALMETANTICQQLYPAVSLPFRTAQ
jgi:DNA-binding IclR family transcriptional regulator